MPSFVGRGTDPGARPYVDVIDLSGSERSPSPVPLVTPATISQPSYRNGSSQPRPHAYNNYTASHQILKPKQQQTTRPPAHAPPQASSSFANFIKPSTPGAFKQNTTPQGYGVRPPQPQFGSSISKPSGSGPARPPQGLKGNFPHWITSGQPNPALNLPSKPKPVSQPKPEPPQPKVDDDPDAERFDLNSVPILASDYERVASGEADAHMRELLSGAVGDGENEEAAFKDGEDEIQGFANGIRLMPHQIRGVNWMRDRESGRKRGGILADVSLGGGVALTSGHGFGKDGANAR